MVLGVLGGGPLGRMTAIAARTMGMRVRVLDPDANAPAGDVADEVLTGAWQDAATAERLACGCTGVACTSPRFTSEALLAAARHAPVRPAAAERDVASDLARQRAWLARHGFPVGPWAEARDPAGLWAALEHEPDAIVTGAAGAEPRPHVRVIGRAGRSEAEALLRGGPVVVEQALAAEQELAVLVARDDARTVVYPPAMLRHEAGRMAWAVVPAPVPAPLARDAVELARTVARTLDVHGLLAVELLALPGGRLVVRDLGAGPHAAFVGTESACVTSQFEQLVRAACGLPLGSPDLVRPAASVPLSADLWQPAAPRLAAALEKPGVRVMMHGYRDAVEGRDMGHLLATAATATDALRRARAAYGRLAPSRLARRLRPDRAA
jgi:5-(carboxyamino)imidazole ribonucleotide synthase